MFIKKVSLLLLLILIVAGCTNIKEKRYSTDIKDEVVSSESITEKELTLFNSAVKNAETEKINLNGKKISEIISEEETRLEKVKQEEEAERHRKEEEGRKRKEELVRIEKEKVEKLENTIQVSLDGKRTILKNTDEWRFSDIVEFDLSFKNTTDKEVRGFKGVVQIDDLFGDEIYRLKLSFDEGVGANQSKQWQGGMEVNQFMDSHTKLANTDFNNLQFNFDMETIIFSDGSTINK